MSDLKLTDGFLAAGRFGLSSILIGLRNAIELFHDHSEVAATKIPATSIPASILLTVHLDRASVLSRHAVPGRGTDIESVNNLSLTGVINTEIPDNDLSIAVNFPVATQALAIYSASMRGGGAEKRAQAFMRVGTVDSLNYVVCNNISEATNHGFTLTDRILIPAGAITIKPVWRILESTFGTTQATAPRRLDLLVFSQ